MGKWVGDGRGGGGACHSDGSVTKYHKIDF